MKTYLILLVFLSVCYTSTGHLERLTGLLAGAHHRIHNKVHEVAGTVLGGLNFNIDAHGQHNLPPVHQQPSNGQPETVIIIVEEGGQGNQGQGHPERPYGTPQQNYNPPPNNGYNPNQGYHNHRPVNSYNGQRPYGQNNYENNYGNGNSGLNQNSYQYGQYGPGQNQNTQQPYQNGQTGQYPNQGGQGNQNQNGYGNNHVNNGNGIPNQNGYGIPNNNVNNNNKPNLNENELKNPEQNTPKPNFNVNYNPTETNYGQHNEAHNAENAHKETSDKTTKKPKDDGPLFVPLNDYTYGGDKITVNAPKRDTGSTGTEEKEEEFAIDIRVKDE